MKIKKDIQVIPQNTKNINFITDYKKAALNVLWLRENQKRTIVFCSVELYPEEVENISEISEIQHSIKGAKSCGLYFQRYVLSAEEALDWYQSDDHKMIWDKSHKEVLVEPKSYINEPEALRFNVTNDLPFGIKSRESIRFCSKFSINDISSVKDYLNQKDVKEWLSQNFIFNLNEYPEYIGSINLVAYNPLFRKINCQIVSNNKENGILFIFEQRNKVHLNGLKLLYAEKRPTGYSDIRCEDINSNVVFVKNDQSIEQIAYAVYCPQRGLLAYNGFYSFVQSINVDFNIAEKEKKIAVPQRNDLSKVMEIIDMPLYHNETFEIKNKDMYKNCYSSLMMKLYQAQEFRNQKQKASNQKILYDENQQLQEKSRVFIRKLISGAKEEVWFIDPYFATYELFSFAEATSYEKVKVHIVTSKLILDKKISNMYEYQNFQKEIDKREDFDAYVMLGEQPIFHDRFIIIDNNVWLSGNSLGTIGERVSYIIKLENPREFLSVFEIYKQDLRYIQPFSDWLKNKGGK